MIYFRLIEIQEMFKFFKDWSKDMMIKSTQCDIIMNRRNNSFKYKTIMYLSDALQLLEIFLG